MDEEGGKSFRYPSSDRQPKQNAENAEDMKNFSSYLAEMLPQETVVTKLFHWISKNIFGKDSVPTDKEIEAILRFFFEVAAICIDNNVIDSSSFAFTEKFVCDFILTNQMCYKRFPHEHLEQTIQSHFSDGEMEDTDLQLKLLGSLFDGLGILFLCHKEQKARIELSDIDSMGVFTAFPVTVTSHRGSEATTEADLLADSRGCHPGYVKLKIQAEHPLIKIPDSLQYEQGDKCLSHQALHCYADKMKRCMEDAETLAFHIHGPAISMTGPQISNTNEYLVLNRDFVLSLPLNTWPHEANEWLFRQRPSGWPDKEQIKAVKEVGCHVVPVANPGDRDCRTEWRISFVLGERHLALSLNQVQRHVYRIIKLIHKHILGNLGVLSTYHLKTTLFWLCEDIPQERWTDEEMGQRFYDFLDLLIDFLSKKCIPNYFIRENNMIDHIEEQLVNSNIDVLHNIRHSPKTMFEEIQTKYDLHFDPLSYLIPKTPIRGFHHIWQVLPLIASKKVSVTDFFSLLAALGEVLGFLPLFNFDSYMRVITVLEGNSTNDDFRKLTEVRHLFKNFKENILRVEPEALSEDSINLTENGQVSPPGKLEELDLD